jgi:hypothetical protein
MLVVDLEIVLNATSTRQLTDEGYWRLRRITNAEKEETRLLTY